MRPSLKGPPSQLAITLSLLAAFAVTAKPASAQKVALRWKYEQDSELVYRITNHQETLAGMVGLSYTMVIGPSGTVKSVRGLDELREKVLGAVPPEQAGMAQALSGELFPDEPISPSDSWHNSFSHAVPILGTMTTNLTFTLTGIEQREGRTVAVISNTGDIVIGNDATSQLPVTFDIGSTDMTGGIDFDVDRGVTLASNMSMTMQMSFAAVGQTMAMGMIQKTSVELIEYGSGR